MKVIFEKIWQWLKAKDIQLNEFLGGTKGETISSRLGRHINRDGCILCKVFCRVPLIFLGWKHCKKSIQDEYVGK